MNLKLLSTSSLALLLNLHISSAQAYDVTAVLDEPSQSIRSQVTQSDVAFENALNASLTLDTIKPSGGLLFFLPCIGGLDYNGDGDINTKDFLAGILKARNKAKKIFDFDLNGDGKVEFNEVLRKTHDSLKEISRVAELITERADAIQNSVYFERFPKNLENSMLTLFNFVKGAAEQTSEHVNLALVYAPDIETSLKGLKSQIQNLGNFGMDATNFAQAKKDIFYYLHIVQEWDRTGNNKKLIASIVKKLSKVKLRA